MHLHAKSDCPPLLCGISTALKICPLYNVPYSLSSLSVLITYIHQMSTLHLLLEQFKGNILYKTWLWQLIKYHR